MLNPATAVKQLEFAWSGLGIATGTPVDYESAKVFYQKELRDARAVKDRSAIVWAQCSLGHILLRLRQYKPAQQQIAEGLKLAVELNDYAAVGYANNLLGDIAYAQGQMEDANLFYRRGWDAYAKIGEEKGQAWSYTNIGNSAQGMGDFTAAAQMYERSLQLIERMNDPRALAWNKNLRGSVGWSTGDYERAWKEYQEALALYEKNNDLHGQAWTLDLMGNLKLAMRDTDEAEKLYRRSRAIVTSFGDDPQAAAWHHYHMGAVYIYRNALDDARDEFEKALRFFDEMKDNLGRSVTLTHLGEIACRQGQTRKGLEYLKQNIELGLTLKSDPVLVDALAAVVQLLQNQGEDKKAISLLMVVLSHPTCRQQTKDRMTPVIHGLETQFTPGEIEKGFRWAKGADLQEMAKGWLISITDNVKPMKAIQARPKKKPAKKRTVLKKIIKKIVSKKRAVKKAPSKKTSPKKTKKK